MNTGVLAEFIDELVFQLMLTNRSLSRKPGVSNCSFRALVFMRRRTGASIREVADFLDVTLPRASTVVDELVKKELVRRETGEDRRRASLYLTSGGRQIADHMHAVHHELASRMLSRLDEPERDALSTAMRECTAALRVKEIR